MEVIHYASYAEIENLWLSRLVDQNIAWLKIAVDNPSLVRVLDGVANLNHEFKPLAESEAIVVCIIEQTRPSMNSIAK